MSSPTTSDRTARFAYQPPTNPALENKKREICAFIERMVDRADADGVVVAMSGGIDSTLTVTLAVEALGSDRVVGLGLPVSKTDGMHVSDARTIADGLGIEFHDIQLRPLLDAFDDVVASAIDGGTDPSYHPGPMGNTMARLRMASLYYVANRRSLLVCGTANRSELLLGYFTKYGDGGTDCNPLGDCYKTEVRALARYVGLPRRIISKTPTAGLRAGQTDIDDLGARYDDIDHLLERYLDREEALEAIVPDLEIDRETAQSLLARYVATEHKRSMPPTPESIDDQSVT